MKGRPPTLESKYIDYLQRYWDGVVKAVGEAPGTPQMAKSRRQMANSVPRTQTILWQSCKAYKMTFESVFNFEVFCLLTKYKDRAMKY